MYVNDLCINLKKWPDALIHTYALTDMTPDMTITCDLTDMTHDMTHTKLTGITNIT